MGGPGDARAHPPLSMHDHTVQSNRPRVQDVGPTRPQLSRHNGARQDKTVSLPRSISYHDSGRRASGFISPPPLKRQRTDTDVPRSSLGRPGLPDLSSLPARSSSKLDLVRRSFNGMPTFDQHEASRQHRDAVLGHARSFPAPPITQYSERPHVTVKTRNGNASTSKRRLDGGVSVKGACRVCEKTCTTNYNPILNCPGCSRLYHDSCRKPPLIDGVDPQRWRCYKCLSGNRVRTTTTSSTQGDSRRSSVVPSILQPEPRLKSRQNTSESRALSLIRPATRVSSKPTSSVALPDRSSQTPHLQSDRHTEAAMPIEETSLVDLTASCSTLSHSKIEKLSSLNTTDILCESVTATASAPVQGLHSSNHNPVSSNPPYTSNFGSAEIQNTPTQSSSGIDASSLPSDTQHNRETEVVIEDDDFVVPAQPLTGSIAALTVLCATCRLRRVFAKSQGEEIHCRNCRNRSRLAETGKLEIPETPNAAFQNRTHVSQSPKNPLSVFSPPVLTSPSAVPWFQSNLVASKPKIKQKKIGNEVTLSPAKTGQKLITEQYKSGEITQDADTLQRSLIRKSAPSTDLASPDRTTTVQASDICAAEEVEGIILPETYSEDLEKDPELPSSHVLPTDDAPNDNDQNPDLVMSSKSEAHNTGGNDMVVQIEEADLAIVLPTDHASPDTEPPSSQKTEEHPGLEITDKLYTNRELTLMTLSAADGSSVTAAEITDWLAKTFPHLKKGQGSWETAVESKLSSTAEIRRDPKIPENVHNLERYAFVNAATKTRYRTEFAKYCEPMTAPLSEVAGPSFPIVQPLVQGVNAGVRKPTFAKKTALSQAPCKTPQPPKAVHITQIVPETLSEGLSTPSMPFERTVKRTPQVVQSSIPDSQRETSYEAFLKAQTWSPESMTEEQKTNKIAEIKARPSRKQFFGSDRRLGHVRRYGRQDVHDESDGAWKPQLKTSSGKSKENEDPSMLDGPTLREVLGLPDNVIPMNDAQSELAFRDGIRINGRLPRSRQIHRVGKMSGGELTNRTS